MASDTLTVARSYSESVNSQDWDRLTRALAPDVVAKSQSADHVSHGPEEIISALQKTAGLFPDTKIEVRNAFASDDQACLELLISGTPADEAQAAAVSGAIGKRVALATCHVYRVRNDQIVSITTYSDRTWREQ